MERGEDLWEVKRCQAAVGCSPVPPNRRPIRESPVQGDGDTTVVVSWQAWGAVAGLLVAVATGEVRWANIKVGEYIAPRMAGDAG